MNILITLCARGGSKGIPRKNIKELNGRPLIDYSIQFAKEIKAHYTNVIIELSTDDQEIRDVADQLGLSTQYIRPAHLASDTAGKVDVIRDVVKYAENIYKVKFDYILDLDVSSPLRTVSDVIEAFKIMTNDSEALTLFSVNKANKNPYFNMVEVNEDGYYSLSKIRDTTTLSRQAAPEVFELNASFYIYSRAYFDSSWKGVVTDKSIVYNMFHICFDLDHPIDFEFMDFLLKNDKLPFELI
ncbi:acylneuraminate cytidylyltransferase family protein [Sphingobacterium pedocola]|uniref:Acylneuraminate cytidylyltransferase family protein n=1 Tax=Sphingobacterium pedocola TaxID=2082722 RepID=A0ABR9TAZ2_9SPHI|nr:acylneuraminate cytidylyltransferase family protein [Sphingobacterium pedocola]MBE8722049.1 acylneuraminate cytidylyltransferase family protein [Sphingobacterium pedocola]